MYEVHTEFSVGKYVNVVGKFVFSTFSKLSKKAPK